MATIVLLLGPILDSSIVPNLHAHFCVPNFTTQANVIRSFCDGTLVALTQIILVVEMLKFSIVTFFKEQNLKREMKKLYHEEHSMEYHGNSIQHSI
jgi:hypothetical protein